MVTPVTHHNSVVSGDCSFVIEGHNYRSRPVISFSVPNNISDDLAVLLFCEISKVSRTLRNYAFLISIYLLIFKSVNLFGFLPKKPDLLCSTSTRVCMHFMQFSLIDWQQLEGCGDAITFAWRLLDAQSENHKDIKGGTASSCHTRAIAVRCVCAVCAGAGEPTSRTAAGNGRFNAVTSELMRLQGGRGREASSLDALAHHLVSDSSNEWLLFPPPLSSEQPCLSAALTTR